MKKKLSTSNSRTDDIELPLLSESTIKQNKSSTRTKSHFIDAFNAEANPLKFASKINKFSFVTFGDVLPLVRRINNQKSPLQLKDLPLPFSFCNIEKKVIQLDEAWNLQQRQGNQPSIIKAVVQAFKKECLCAAFVCFMMINGKLYCSLLMGDFIRSITENNLGDDVDKGEIFFSAAMFGIVTAIIVFLENWYWHLAFLIATGIRNTIIGFTYKKLQSIALSSLQEINVGKVINLISNDVNEIDKGFIQVVPAVLSPYTILMGAIFLWGFFSYTTIFGILSLIGFLILSNYLSNLSESIKSQKSAITDERIKLTSELIECIRLVKMYAWEKIFKGAILTLRQKEILKIAKLRALFVLGEGVAATSPQSALAIMCVIFTMTGGVLSPQKIYTSLMILSFTSLWGVTVPHFGMMFYSSCRVLKKRLEGVLNIRDVMDLNEAVKSFSTIKQKSPPATPVVFKNYTASWKEGAKPCLSDINLTLNPGELTTVIGTIGSGKTCFLLSFLREIPYTQGKLSLNGKVAYVEQEPIIFSGTIKSNILFGLEFDEHLYTTVLRASNLSEDLKQFDDRDDTVVGERGITLSGGQRARLSLARALYSQSDIYLLDDPLSAVDSKVGRHMFNYAIKGELLKDKVVVLVTHHLNYAKESDRVLLFSEGKVMGDGKFEDLTKSDNSLFTKFKEVEEEEKTRKSTTKQSSAHQKNDKVETKPQEKTEKKVTGEDAKNEVTLTTYKKYVQAYGKYLNLFGLLLIYLANAGLLIYFSTFVGYWGQAHSNFYSNETRSEGESFNNLPYILAVIFLAIFLILGGVLRSILTNRIILKANTNMHDKALESLIRAPVLFFDQTPIGALLNRFSNDLGNLDSVNSNQLQIVIDGFIHMIVRMITLIIINPYLALPMIIVMLMLLRLKKVFEKPVMETKRIDLSSRSPMYSEVSATVNGLLAIRVFRQGGTFIRRFCDLLYNNIRGFLYMERIIRYFSFAMSATLDTLTILGTFVCLIMAFYTNLDAALFGLALLTLQDVAAIGGKVVRVSLLVDINMQSVDRIMKYHELTPEAPDHVPERDTALAKPWPNQGKITLNNVFMKYRPELDYVLKGLTFSVSGGNKIGIVGRTGAGKSSIIQALFRMTELESMPGSSIEIDGVNISKIGLAPLRESLSIIPQTPVVFTGKIKRNLDPFNHFTDFELWQVLQEVNLRDHVEGLEKKLETDMTMSSSVFSAGQKQLICLARAILRKSKIIVLDEATANVDIETDDFIQRKIMERFRDCTVITIAHRLITIANYDKVLVMDKGNVAEYDAPYLLLVKNEGDKQITNKEGFFAQMVLNSGDSMAKKIFEITMKKYYGK